MLGCKSILNAQDVDFGVLSDSTTLLVDKVKSTCHGLTTANAHEERECKCIFPVIDAASMLSFDADL